MGGNTSFGFFFGGVWLAVGIAFLAAIAGVNLFADSNTLNEEAPFWLFAAVGVVSSAAGAAIIHFAYKAAARDRHLVQFGVPVTATVIDIQRSLIEINRQARWHVLYRYEHTDGRSLNGKSRALPGEAVWGFKPGDRVDIKVDPQHPEESLFLVGR